MAHAGARALFLVTIVDERIEEIRHGAWYFSDAETSRRFVAHARRVLAPIGARIELTRLVAYSSTVAATMDPSPFPELDRLDDPRPN